MISSKCDLFRKLICKRNNPFYYKINNYYFRNSVWCNSYVCGAPGLVDRVFAVHAGGRGFNSHRRHMSERFFRSSRPGYPHPVYSEMEKVVSEWRLLIAVSLNVGGGVRPIKTGKTVLFYSILSHNLRRSSGHH